MVAACIAGVVVTKNILNTARERLSFEQFRAFVIRQAVLLCSSTAAFAFVAIYSSLAIGSHDMPKGYVSLYGSIFPPGGVACDDETTAITFIESLPCGLKPLCGFDSWRTACWRIQLAEGLRSMNLFLPTVYVHILFMYTLFAIYGHGQAVEQNAGTRWRSMNSASIKQSKVAPTNEGDHAEDATPDGPKLEAGALRQPSGAGSAKPAAPHSKSRFTLTHRSFRRVANSAMAKAEDDLSSAKGQELEETKGQSKKTSYLHLFKPHMLVVLLCLLVVNIMLVYLFVRWLFLGALLSHPVAVANARNLGEALVLPGVCYGSCGTNAFVVFITLWATIFVVLNLSRLWFFLLGRKAESRELLWQQREEERVNQRVKEEEEAGECSFYFLSADFIRNFPPNRPVPRFQKLRKVRDALLKRTLNFEALLCGRHASSVEYCVVSHRWMAPESPDDDLAQLTAIKAHLAQNPGIKYVWYDFWCMPQGEDQTLAEKAEFRHMLSNINNLFAGMKVLILLDLSYMSRFWTQYEAWLSMQSCTAEGLLPAPKVRATIVPLYNANPLLAETLESIWSQKKPQDAHHVLADKDICVTNQNDKAQHLPKILNFDEQVRLAFQSQGQAEVMDVTTGELDAEHDL